MEYMYIYTYVATARWMELPEVETKVVLADWKVFHSSIPDSPVAGNASQIMPNTLRLDSSISSYDIHFCFVLSISMLNASIWHAGGIIKPADEEPMQM